MHITKNNSVRNVDGAILMDLEEDVGGVINWVEVLFISKIIYARVIER